MKRLTCLPVLAASAIIAVACWPVPAAHAQSIPYPDAGTENLVQYTFTATSTGDLSAYYFANSGAVFDEQLGLLVNGVSTGITGLDNHSSSEGDVLDFGTVHAGDVLTFYINVADTQIGQEETYYSNTALNGDGVNHVYSAMWAGGLPPGGSVAIPAGVYVGFEDLSPLYDGYSDFNYTDEQFVFTDTSMMQVPEPGSIAMLLVGGLCLSGICRVRRRARSAAIITAPRPAYT